MHKQSVIHSSWCTNPHAPACPLTSRAAHHPLWDAGVQMWGTPLWPSHHTHFPPPYAPWPMQMHPSWPPGVPMHPYGHGALPPHPAWHAPPPYLQVRRCRAQNMTCLDQLCCSPDNELCHLCRNVLLRCLKGRSGCKHACTRRAALPCCRQACTAAAEQSLPATCLAHEFRQASEHQAGTEPPRTWTV